MQNSLDTIMPDLDCLQRLSVGNKSLYYSKHTLFCFVFGSKVQADGNQDNAGSVNGNANQDAQQQGMRWK